jgi:sulfite exporter TauE/SafE
MSTSPEFGFAGAFLFGLFGSISHCVAMCGALVTGIGQAGGAPPWKRLTVYHTGRLITYTLIGALVGLTGSLVNFAGGASGLLRDGAAVFAGVVMVLTGVSMLGTGAFLPERLLSTKWLTNKAGKLYGRKELGAVFALGLLLGFLPCGLIYTAASYALAEANPLTGGLLMLSFGLGTLPALAGTSWLINKFRRYGDTFRKAAGLLLILSGGYYLVAGFPG